MIYLLLFILLLLVTSKIFQQQIWGLWATLVVCFTKFKRSLQILIWTKTTKMYSGAFQPPKTLKKHQMFKLQLPAYCCQALVSFKPSQNECLLWQDRCWAFPQAQKHSINSHSYSCKIIIIYCHWEIELISKTPN